MQCQLKLVLLTISAQDTLGLPSVITVLQQQLTY